MNIICFTIMKLFVFKSYTWIMSVEYLHYLYRNDGMEFLVLKVPLLDFSRMSYDVKRYKSWIIWIKIFFSHLLVCKIKSAIAMRPPDANSLTCNVIIYEATLKSKYCSQCCYLKFTAELLGDYSHVVQVLENVDFLFFILNLNDWMALDAVETLAWSNYLHNEPLYKTI